MDPNTYFDENTLIEHRFVVTGKREGWRLDKFLSALMTDYSRTFVQRLIKEKKVTVNEGFSKVANIMEVGDRVFVKVPEIKKIELLAQEIKFDVIYEDDVMMAINKPPGLIIHPGTGRIDGTLANGLMYYFKKQGVDFGGSLRPGIVHRIDKDTTGVLLVAKDLVSQAYLMNQFQERTVKKEYLTFVHGTPKFDEGKVDLPIGHDKKEHIKRAIRDEEHGGKASLTYYDVLERFEDYTLVKCKPKTGRTHQIRVHMKSLGHPLMIDETYGVNTSIFLSDLTGRPQEPDELPLIDRLTLHAYRIHFKHPVTEERMTLEAEIPADMKRLIDALRKYKPFK